MNKKTIAKAGNTYEHFKGKRVKVLAIATHTETADFFVVYVEDGITWARPREMFEDGRFTLVEDPKP